MSKVRHNDERTDKRIRLLSVDFTKLRQDVSNEGLYELILGSEAGKPEAFRYPDDEIAMVNAPHTV